MTRRFQGWLTATLFLSGTACSDREPVSPDSPSITERIIAGIVVSDPRAAKTNSLVSAPAASVAVSAESIVYVSVAPGTIPDATTVQITNPRNGFTVAIPVINGGFDPVPVSAGANDELKLAYTTATETVRLTMTVPRKRPPAVVRTSPQNGRTDVALNVSVEIVFSEPVDPATANSINVRLMNNGVAVPAKIVLVGDFLGAILVPDSALKPLTTYEIVVSNGLKDLTGDALEASYNSLFVTGSGGSTFSFESRVPDNGWMNPDDTATVIAVIRDTNGNVLTAGSVTWSVLPSNSAVITQTSTRAALIRVTGSSNFRVTATLLSKSAGLLVNVPDAVKYAYFGFGFIWSEATGMTRFPVPEGAVNVQPAAINDRGDVVGTMNYLNNVDGGIISHAFFWSKEGGFVDIDGPDRLALSNAYAVDPTGVVVGWGRDRNGISGAFTWTRAGGRQPVDPTASYHVTGAAGWVAGIRYITRAQPYRWPLSGPLEELEMPAFANVGEVVSINNSGEAVGYDGLLEGINDNGATNAVFWGKDGKRVAIISCPLRTDCYAGASAINNHGEVVGYLSKSPFRGSFRWSVGSGPRFFDSPGFAEFSPIDINDAGDVLGQGRNGASFQPVLIRASGEVVKIQMLPGIVRASAPAINNRGDVVGTAYQR